MLKGIWLSDEELERIVDLLNDIDVEIGSTITYADNYEKIISNMRRANDCIFKIKDCLGENS